MNVRHPLFPDVPLMKAPPGPLTYASPKVRPAIFFAFSDHGLDEDKLPHYGDPGRILVDVHKESDSFTKLGYDILDYDRDSGVYWINEGVGFEYWLEGHVDFPRPGRYLIEDIRGRYYRGTWGFDDDDEEWEYGKVKRVFFWRTLAPRSLSEAYNVLLGELAKATGINRLLSHLSALLTKPEADNCEICKGTRGGVRGNENRVGDQVMCDYCHLDYRDIEY